jgi:3-methyladenine DNA glycosylase/8-oxoguanine DNA glycosylase
MNLKEAISRICSIPGIGESTAHYIAMRALGEPDAFPFADAGVRSSLGRGENPAALAEVVGIAESWRPWRAYAAMHIYTADPGRRAGHLPHAPGASAKKLNGLPMG